MIESLDVKTAQAAIEADKQARIAEFNEIVQREATRLRVTLVPVVEKVALGNGVWGDRAVVNLVAE